MICSCLKVIVEFSFIYISTFNNGHVHKPGFFKWNYVAKKKKIINYYYKFNIVEIWLALEQDLN